MPAGLVQTYRAFAYNNAWANDRLLTACANLDQEDFAAERTGFFPSLQLTLNHIYVIDLFYVDALEGGWLGPKAWENPIPCASLAELKRAQEAVDKRLIAVCNALTPELLDGIVRVNRDTRVQTERRDRQTCISSSTRSTIVDRPTPCSPERPSNRRNSTSFFRSPKRRCGPANSTGLVGPRKLCGAVTSSCAIVAQCTVPRRMARRLQLRWRARRDSNP
jgi:uncharacterized damage-inducible protein DinB